MRRRSGFLISALAVACIGAPAALAGKPIAPNQAFEANVNGQPAGAVVHVTCDADAAGQGHPLPGQYVQVKHEKVVPDHEPSPFGFTGDASSIVVIAQFGSPTTSSAASSPSIPVLVVANLTRYRKKAKLPPALELPCTGTGTFAFRPLDGQGAVTAFVDVTYEP
jgi:hypothetical protein